MVKYSDITGVLQDFLVDDHKHLFQIGGVNIMFWAMIGRNNWRIVTDLPLNNLQDIARILNEAGERFNAEVAWDQLKRPIYATPPMTSQLVGKIGNIDTISRLWSVFTMRCGEIRHLREGSLSTENDELIYARRKMPRTKVPDMPRGRDLLQIAKRLSKEEIKAKKTVSNESERVIQRKKASSKTKEEEIADFITELRSQGHTYKQMMQITSEQFGERITRYRVWKTLNNRGLTNN